MIGSGIFMFVAGGFSTEHENETARLPANFIFLINVVLMVKHLLDYRNLLQAKTVA